MNKTTWAYVTGGAIAVVLVIVVIWLATRTGRTSQPGGSAANAVPGAVTVTPSGPQTKLPVPSGTTVPDATSKVSGDVAKPLAVTQAAPGVDSKVRSFTIQINNNQFTPAQVVAYVNDIVHITFTAVDKDYDVTQPDYGFRLVIPKGQTKLLEGQFTSAGKYVFYCASCGGPDQGPVGYLVAVPR